MRFAVIPTIFLLASTVYGTALPAPGLFGDWNLAGKNTVSTAVSGGANIVGCALGSIWGLAGLGINIATGTVIKAEQVTAIAVGIAKVSAQLALNLTGKLAGGLTATAIGSIKGIESGVICAAAEAAASACGLTKEVSAAVGQAVSVAVSNCGSETTTEQYAQVISTACSTVVSSYQVEIKSVDVFTSTYTTTFCEKLSTH